ncbi:EFR1 family ferrodoxin [Clostridium sediminicola]|uniref:EFR1 family ferrodoxin n=1 Tax=Clostridium sediminicola TaxID=3114879 RepID=UPI0031F274E7
MKTGICYFSATGNSFDLANKLKGYINNSGLFYIPNLDIDVLEKFERIILVSPIYLFGTPIPVKEFIKKLSIFKDKDYYAVLNYGGFSGNAIGYFGAEFEKNSLNLKDAFKVKMPENFTIINLTPTVPSRYIQRTLKAADKKIENIAEKINANSQRKIQSNIFSFCNNIHEKGEAKWNSMSRDFTISKSCNQCGLCMEICPEKNIKIENSKIVFLDRCVSCLACYHRCPQNAINYKNKTIGKKRYQNPNVNFKNMR